MTPHPKQARPADVLIGSRIIVLRRAKGMSQTALGRVIGVTFQQVQKYEKGVNRIGAGRMQDIADALGVTIADLYGGEMAGSDGEPVLFSLLSLDGAGEMLRAYAELPPQGREGFLTAIRGLAQAFGRAEAMS